MRRENLQSDMDVGFPLDTCLDLVALLLCCDMLYAGEVATHAQIESAICVQRDPIPCLGRLCLFICFLGQAKINPLRHHAGWKPRAPPRSTVSREQPHNVNPLGAAWLSRTILAPSGALVISSKILEPVHRATQIPL